MERRFVGQHIGFSSMIAIIYLHISTTKTIYAGDMTRACPFMEHDMNDMRHDMNDMRHDMNDMRHDE